jgi:DNA-binding GntR family transcriptional regulator
MAREHAADGAYETLKAMIIRGHIAPGLRLTELDVAARLGVSRTPAREALRRLHADGLLVGSRQDRRLELAVAPLTREDIVEVYEAMAALEGAVARRAARLPPTDRRELARRLRAAETAFRAAAREEPPDYDALFERHGAFHNELVDACAGPRMRRLLDLVRPLSDRYEWMYAPMVGPDHRPTFEEHQRVIAAVRAGSADRAEAAVRANWLNGAERLLAAMARWGERGGWTRPQP